MFAGSQTRTYILSTSWRQDAEHTGGGSTAVKTLERPSEKGRKATYCLSNLAVKRVGASTTVRVAVADKGT